MSRDVREAPYGRVVVLERGRQGWRIRYLDGFFAGREARIPREHLR